MNDSKQIAALEGLAEAAKARVHRSRSPQLASIRVSPGAYLAAASVLTFVAALLLRSERDLWALVSLAVAWLLIPVLALADRIAFDGEFLTRHGPMPFVLQLISGRSQQLNISDFEKVDTNAVRTLRRGGRVRYRYRTQVLGRNTIFAFASGGRSYREMVRQLFPVIHEDKIDLRTRELRDYLCEPRALTIEVQNMHLASSEVLDNANPDLKMVRTRRAAAERDGVAASALELDRAAQFRLLGNRLRIAGRLREAREAFRRALNVIPRDAWLIYDFARLLRSQASALGDARLLSRARAALRLSAVRGKTDAKLLSLIGESLLECGEPARAQQIFQRVIDLAPRNFRARVGLADVALRNGKLAHVIHQYRDAAQVAGEKALLRYTRREADYYARLNDDDDYLAAELRRINWLQVSVRVRQLAARVTNASILVALVGPSIDSRIAGVGWSLASSSLFAWITSLFLTRYLSDRRPPRQTQ
ncbi:MAG TPA: hypothetical protein VJ124_16115 [Pyrinomonadaceae bacterium]|nr:hypothetical protein [Pyrinomonadaceae bacterium]